MNTSVTGIFATDSPYSATELASTAGNSMPGTAQAGMPKTIGNTGSQQDQVKLSPAAQAKSLYQQGESVKEIAQNLGCTTQDVDTYLGVTTSTTSTTSSSGSTSGGGAQYSSSQVAQLLMDM
jgi:hypothetical protein